MFGFGGVFLGHFTLSFITGHVATQAVDVLTVNVHFALVKWERRKWKNNGLNKPKTNLCTTNNFSIGSVLNTKTVPAPEDFF